MGSSAKVEYRIAQSRLLDRSRYQADVDGRRQRFWAQLEPSPSLLPRANLGRPKELDASVNREPSGDFRKNTRRERISRQAPDQAHRLAMERNTRHSRG